MAIDDTGIALCTVVWGLGLVGKWWRRGLERGPRHFPYKLRRRTTCGPQKVIEHEP
jgi:hypothetical protein